jgi:hypothetical protein
MPVGIVNGVGCLSQSSASIFTQIDNVELCLRLRFTIVALLRALGKVFFSQATMLPVNVVKILPFLT